MTVDFRKLFLLYVRRQLLCDAADHFERTWPENWDELTGEENAALTVLRDEARRAEGFGIRWGKS